MTDPANANLPSTKMVGGAAAPIVGLVVDRVTESDYLGFTAALLALVIVYFVPELNQAWVRRTLERAGQ